MTLSPSQTDIDRLLAPDILPTFSVASFVAKGATLEGAAISLTCPLTRLCRWKSKPFFQGHASHCLELVAKRQCLAAGLGLMGHDDRDLKDIMFQPKQCACLRLCNGLIGTPRFYPLRCVPIATSSFSFTL